MKKILLSAILVFLLSACGSEPASAPAQTVDTTTEPSPSSDSASPVSNQAASDQEANAQLEEQKNKDVAQEVVRIQKLLTERYPDLSSEALSINKVDLGSTVLFEIVAGDVVFYTNPSVDYVLSGSLFLGQGDEVVNFTSRLAQQAPIAPQPEEETVDGRSVFNALPLEAGLNYTYGEPVHKIAVFEDPDCGFCQAFHKDLKKFGSELNVQITVFPFILETRHPMGVTRARALMCAPNPAKAWDDWMIAASSVDHSGLDALWATWAPLNAPVASCPQSGLVDMWQNVGKQLGFSATPTIMFESGAVMEGRPSKEDLQQALADAKKIVDATPDPAPLSASPAKPSSVE